MSFSKINTILVLMLLGLLPLAQAADNPEVKTITLKEAIDIAMAKNPSLKAASDALEGARSQREQAKAMYMPQVNVQGSFTNGNNPVYVFGTLLTQRSFTAEDFNIDKLNNPDPRNNFKGEISLYQPIWEGGRIRAQNSIAKLNEQIKTNEVELSRQNLLFDVVSHYYAVQLSQENFNTAQAALRSAEANLARIQDLYDNGMVVKSDLLRMQVFMADVKRRLLEAENNLHLAKAALDVDLGRSLGVNFQIATPLQKLELTLPDEMQYQELALLKRPEILNLQKAIEITRMQTKDAKGLYMPGIGFFSAAEYNRGTVSGAAGGNYTVGVQVRWNLFDGFYRGAKVAQSRSKEAELQNKLDQYSNQISLQVKDHFLKMRTALQQYEVANAVVSQADEGLRITKDRYGAGLATLTDLLNAETARLGSRTSLSMALYQYNISFADLERAAGTLDLSSPLFN